MKIKYYLAFLLTALFMFSLTLTVTAEGGREQDPDPSTYSLMPQIPLTEEQEAAIRADYAAYFIEIHGEEQFGNVTADDIMIGGYYGPYSGCYALFIWSQWDNWNLAITYRFIGEKEFMFVDSRTLIVYKNSQFFPLDTAYNDSIITANDLLDLWEHFKPDISFNRIRPSFSKGDLNGDGRVTSADYLILKRIFLGTYTPASQQLTAADINKDGIISSIDYLGVKRFFFQTYYFYPY